MYRNKFYFIIWIVTSHSFCENYGLDLDSKQKNGYKDIIYNKYSYSPLSSSDENLDESYKSSVIRNQVNNRIRRNIIFIPNIYPDFPDNVKRKRISGSREKSTQTKKWLEPEDLAYFSNENTKSINSNYPREKLQDSTDGYMLKLFPNIYKNENSEPAFRKKRVENQHPAIDKGFSGSVSSETSIKEALNAKRKENEEILRFLKMLPLLYKFNLSEELNSRQSEKNVYKLRHTQTPITKVTDHLSDHNNLESVDARTGYFSLTLPEEQKRRVYDSGSNDKTDYRNIGIFEMEPKPDTSYKYYLSDKPHVKDKPFIRVPLRKNNFFPPENGKLEEKGNKSNDSEIILTPQINRISPFLENGYDTNNVQRLRLSDDTYLPIPHGNVIGGAKSNKFNAIKAPEENMLSINPLNILLSHYLQRRQYNPMKNKIHQTNVFEKHRYYRIPKKKVIDMPNLAYGKTVNREPIPSIVPLYVKRRIEEDYLEKQPNMPIFPNYIFPQKVRNQEVSQHNIPVMETTIDIASSFESNSERYNSDNFEMETAPFDVIVKKVSRTVKHGANEVHPIGMSPENFRYIADNKIYNKKLPSNVNVSWYLYMNCSKEECEFTNSTKETELLQEGWILHNCTSYGCIEMYPKAEYIHKVIGVLLLVLSLCIFKIIGFLVIFYFCRRIKMSKTDDTDPSLNNTTNKDTVQNAKLKLDGKSNVPASEDKASGDMKSQEASSSRTRKNANGKSKEPKYLKSKSSKVASSNNSSETKESNRIWTPPTGNTVGKATAAEGEVVGNWKIVDCFNESDETSLENLKNMNHIRIKLPEMSSKIRNTKTKIAPRLNAIKGSLEDISKFKNQYNDNSANISNGKNMLKNQTDEDFQKLIFKGTSWRENISSNLSENEKTSEHLLMEVSSNNHDLTKKL